MTAWMDEARHNQPHFSLICLFSGIPSCSWTLRLTLCHQAFVRRHKLGISVSTLFCPLECFESSAISIFRDIICNWLSRICGCICGCVPILCGAKVHKNGWEELVTLNQMAFTISTKYSNTWLIFWTVWKFCCDYGLALFPGLPHFYSSVYNNTWKQLLFHFHVLLWKGRVKMNEAKYWPLLELRTLLISTHSYALLCGSMYANFLSINELIFPRHIIILASFPGSPGTRICIHGRAWYLFSHEHDIIKKKIT